MMACVRQFVLMKMMEAMEVNGMAAIEVAEVNNAVTMAHPHQKEVEATPTGHQHWSESPEALPTDLRH